MGITVQELGQISSLVEDLDSRVADQYSLTDVQIDDVGVHVRCVDLGSFVFFVARQDLTGGRQGGPFAREAESGCVCRDSAAAEELYCSWKGFTS